MTTSDERTRAMVWAGAFLVELARSPELPLAVRQRAVWIARHFPTVEDVRMMAVFRYEPTGVDFHAKLSRDFHPKLSHPVAG